MDNGGDQLQPQITAGSPEESFNSDLSVEIEECTSMDTPIPMHSTSAVSFLTCAEVREQAMQMVKQMCEIVDVKQDEGAALLRKHRWDMNAAIIQFTNQLESLQQQVTKPEPSTPVEHADEIVPVTNDDVDEIVPVLPPTAPDPVPVALVEDDAHRTLKTVWRRIMGYAACATCFELKNGATKLLFATDCGIVLCEQCWGGYFRAEFGGGVRGLIRCPFPDCNSIVPLWLLEKCYETSGNDETAAIMACYRHEFVSDFVFASDNLQFCPSPSCESLVRVHAGWREYCVPCPCGYEFCFYCLNEAHFPAECQHAKEVASFLAQREMYRLADVFTGAKQCSNCGILIENVEGCDSITCAMCNHQLNWSAMSSCRESLAKACCSRFSKRSAAIERQLGDVLTWYPIMMKDLEQFDRHQVVPGRYITSETWNAYLSQTRRIFRLLKWTKVSIMLGAQGEQLDGGIIERMEKLQISVDTFRTHLDNQNATLSILQALQDILRKGEEDVRKALEIVIRAKDETQLI